VFSSFARNFGSSTSQNGQSSYTGKIIKAIVIARLHFTYLTTTDYSI
jgi:hypothetical protein